MKKRIILMILAMVATGGLFAQEKSGYIKPTFGAGVQIAMADGETETNGEFGVDVDFVHSTGFTIGFASTVTTTDANFGLLRFGIGYTFNSKNWCVGAKVMFMGLGNVNPGFGVNGTYWFNNNLGITAIGEIFFPEGYSINSLRLAISMKL